MKQPYMTGVSGYYKGKSVLIDRMLWINEEWYFEIVTSDNRLLIVPAQEVSH